MTNKISRVFVWLALIGFLGPIAYSMIYSSTHGGNPVDLRTGIDFMMVSMASLVVLVIFGVVGGVGFMGKSLREKDSHQLVGEMQAQEIHQTSKIEMAIGIISVFIITATAYYLFR